MQQHLLSFRFGTPLCGNPVNRSGIRHIDLLATATEAIPNKESPVPSCCRCKPALAIYRERVTMRKPNASPSGMSQAMVQSEGQRTLQVHAAPRVAARGPPPVRHPLFLRPQSGRRDPLRADLRQPGQPASLAARHLRGPPHLVVRRQRQREPTTRTIRRTWPRSSGRSARRTGQSPEHWRRLRGSCSRTWPRNNDLALVAAHRVECGNTRSGRKADRPELFVRMVWWCCQG